MYVIITYVTVYDFYNHIINAKLYTINTKLFLSNLLQLFSQSFRHWELASHLPFHTRFMFWTHSAEIHRKKQELPESISRVIEAFAILMGMFSGSIFSWSLCVLANILSSPLLWSDSYSLHNDCRNFTKSSAWGFSTVLTDFFFRFWAFWVFFVFCILWQNDLPDHRYYKFYFSQCTYLDAMVTHI